MSIEVSRRSVLIGGSVVAGTALFGTPARASVPTSAGIPDLDVHVIVVDGMRPDELRSELTPTLTGLAAGGIHYPDASAITIAETLPNHTAMMTGVLPARSGVPANSVYDPSIDKKRDPRSAFRPAGIDGSGSGTHRTRIDHCECAVQALPARVVR